MKRYNNMTWHILALTLLTFTVTGCPEPKAPKNITVKTITAAQRELQTSLNLSGVLLPAQTSDIASRITGQVKFIGADVGSPVKADDVLVELDTELLNAQLMQARAGLKSAEAAAQLAQGQVDLAKITLDAAQKNYNRIKALHDSGTTSQSQLDDVADKLDIAKKQQKNAGGPALAQARAAIDTARANIQNLQVQIENATIRSPFDGIVTNRNADPGEVVSPGVVVMSVADTSTLKLKSRVSQDLLPLLSVGQSLDVTIDIYPDRVFTGTISGVGPIAVNTGGIFPVEITVPNDGSILSGLSAHATLHLTDQHGVVVPIAAVLESGETSEVFIIQNGVAVKRIVTTGLRNDQDVQILTGLEADERVAITNIRALTDNMRVDVQ
jgi:HlyD family secretion protein